MRAEREAQKQQADKRRPHADSFGWIEPPTAQRENAPIASPSSLGRPTPSPFQNGTAPGSLGAGVTMTRSRPISSIRQVLAPSRKVWPGRAS